MIDATRKLLLNLTVWAVLFWLRGFTEMAFSRLETTAAVRQASNLPPVRGQELLRLDLPSLTLYCLMLTSAFVIWFVFAKKENRP